jgi:hypothetical protein
MKMIFVLDELVLYGCKGIKGRGGELGYGKGRGAGTHKLDRLFLSLFVFCLYFCEFFMLGAPLFDPILGS